MNINKIDYIHVNNALFLNTSEMIPLNVGRFMYHRKISYFSYFLSPIFRFRPECLGKSLNILSGPNPRIDIPIQTISGSQAPTALHQEKRKPSPSHSNTWKEKKKPTAFLRVENKRQPPHPPLSSVTTATRHPMTNLPAYKNKFRRQVPCFNLFSGIVNL